MKSSDPINWSCRIHGSNKTKPKKHGSNKTTGKKCRIQQNNAEQLTDPTKQNVKMGSNKTNLWIARMQPNKAQQNHGFKKQAAKNAESNKTKLRNSRIQQSKSWIQ